MRPILAIIISALLCVSSQAQETQPWGSRDFSSKKIGVPPKGTRPSLVQIDPEEEPYFLTPAYPEREGNADAASGFGTGPVASEAANWFWAEVSPDISDGSPTRLPRAIGQLALAESDLKPSWGGLANMVVSFGEEIARSAQGSRVSPALALAVMSVESSGRPDVVSSAGAKGLMQLMPATAQRFGVNDPLDPAQSISGGVAYLDFLLRTFGNDPILAVAAYNAGEGAVARNKGVPPFAETRNYVPKVIAAWSVARLFCAVPPDLVTDPCSFFSGPGGNSG